MVGLIITLTLCSFAAAALIWRYDLYDKEPWWALLIAAAMGAMGMYAVGGLQVWCADWVGSAPVRFALVAAVTEEVLKLLAVVIIALGLRKIFNDPVDGIIYGSVVGFGCALEESVAYFFEPVSRPWATAPEVIRLLGHLIFGGLAGFGVGLIRSKGVPRRRAWIGFAVGFGAAVGLHFVWDVIASRMFTRSAPTDTDRVLQVSIMLAGFIAYAAAMHCAWSDACREFEGAHWRRLLWAPTKRQRTGATRGPRRSKRTKRPAEKV